MYSQLSKPTRPLSQQLTIDIKPAKILIFFRLYRYHKNKIFFVKILLLHCNIFQSNKNCENFFIQIESPCSHKSHKFENVNIWINSKWNIYKYIFILFMNMFFLFLNWILNFLTQLVLGKLIKMTSFFRWALIFIDTNCHCCRNLHDLHANIYNMQPFVT